jgi:hypothetical protein
MGVSKGKPLTQVHTQKDKRTTGPERMENTTARLLNNLQPGRQKAAGVRDMDNAICERVLCICVGIWFPAAYA